MIYNFKNDYFTKLSDNNAGFIDKSSYMEEDGKIKHDIDTIAERFLQNSEILGEKGEQDLKRLKKTKIPLPSFYNSK